MDIFCWDNIVMSDTPATQLREQLHSGLNHHSDFVETLNSLRLEELAIKIGTLVLEQTTALMDELRFMGTYVTYRLLGPKPPAARPISRLELLEEERQAPRSQAPQLPPSGHVRIINRYTVQRDKPEA